MDAGWHLPPESLTPDAGGTDRLHTCCGPAPGRGPGVGEHCIKAPSLSQVCQLKKRLKNEPNVSCMALTDDASRIVFGVTLGNILKVWDPLRRKHKIIPGYENLHLNVDSKLQVIEGGSKAILLSGEISLWDLDNGTIVSVFTPDTKICCLSLATDRKTILVGMSDTPSLITLKVASREKQSTSSTGIDLFGEESTSSEDESNDKDQPLSI